MTESLKKWHAPGVSLQPADKFGIKVVTPKQFLQAMGKIQ